MTALKVRVDSTTDRYLLGVRLPAGIRAIANSEVLNNLDRLLHLAVAAFFESIPRQRHRVIRLNAGPFKRRTVPGQITDYRNAEHEAVPYLKACSS